MSSVSAAGAVCALGCILLLAASALAAPKEPPRIGDAGSEFDPAKYDDRFPDAKDFAKAGVEGGIPLRSATPVARKLKPGDDIQAAINGAGRGVVLLAPGIYQLDKTLQMKSGVILRGEDKEKTILEYGVQDKDCRNLFMFKKVERAAIEDLTMRQAQVMAIDEKKYLMKYDNYPGFAHDDAATIEMVGASNCWVQNCQVLYSLSRPVRIYGNSKHITFRDNLIDRALHKGGGGSGYMEVVGASYVLFYNETIKNIRHVCLDGVCDYTVLIHCKLSVDVNWHCIAPMNKTLVERCESDADRNGHQWGLFSHYKDAVGPDNYVYLFKPNFDDGNVYGPVWPGLGKEEKGAALIQKKNLPQPKHGTLYPVTGLDREPNAVKGAGK